MIRSSGPHPAVLRAAVPPPARDQDEGGGRPGEPEISRWHPGDPVDGEDDPASDGGHPQEQGGQGARGAEPVAAGHGQRGQGSGGTGREEEVCEDDVGIEAPGGRAGVADQGRVLRRRPAAP